MTEHPAEADIAIIGGGASGLAAAIFAAEHDPKRVLRIVIFEGAQRIGAKILVSGGGRCNVTNAEVTENDFWGSSRTIIRNVLRSFDVSRTIQWFQSLGVELAREESGKYFPVTNRAASVRDALVNGAIQRGCRILRGTRIENLLPASCGLRLTWSHGNQSCLARRVILATGGLALPKSGSDGAGLRWLRALGHTIIEPVPALVPLVLARENSIGGRFAEFSGVSFPCVARFVSHQDHVTYETRGPVLFTHFGVSGPAILDLSRHVTRELFLHRKPVEITIGHMNFETRDAAINFLQNQRLKHPRRQVATVLAELYPERFAHALAAELAPRRLCELRRDEMRMLGARMSALPLKVIGDRGFAAAEVTAGGVSLLEVNWRTLESQKVPGVHLCGEILDVDGRLGGFNFQWAWSSAFIAGRGAALALLAGQKSG